VPVGTPMEKGKLKSPGWGADSRVLRDLAALGETRGAWAPPSAPLASIENVAGMKVMGTWCHASGVPTLVWPVGLLNAPFVRKAVLLLQADPIEEGAVLRPLEETPDSAMYNRHLKELLRLRQLRVCPNPRAGGIYSAVYKDPPEARTIFNHKYVNEFAVDGVPFSLLSSSGFIQVLQSYDFGADDWTVVHGDVKSAYHQLPAGSELGRCTCVRINDQWLMPTTVVMGHKNSCGICQGIMFGVLLHATEEQRALLGIPVEAGEWEEAPGVVYLTNGGVIILVYDSFFAIVPSSLQRAWYDHIKSNCKDVNCVLKFLYLEPRLSKDRDPCWTQPFAYCGVAMWLDGRGLTWALEDESLEVWRRMSAMSLLKTPRTLYTFLGYLRFAQPICGMSKRQLGPLTLEQSHLGMVTDWDAEVVPESVIRELCALVLNISNTPRHRKSHLPRKRGGCEAVFIAVDATPWRFSVVPMAPSASGGSSIIKEYCMSGAFVDVPRFSEFLKADKSVSIDTAEALVMCLGVEVAMAFRAAVWVFGGDNQGVAYGYDKGYSRSKEVNEVIIRANVPHDQIMVIADIPTRGQLADVATRPEEKFSAEDVQFREEVSWVRMWDAYVHWYEAGVETYHLRYCNECCEKEKVLAQRLGIGDE